MLFLTFAIGDGRYALDTGVVEEILPLVRITPIPGAPAGIAGTFNYRGNPAPAVDLVQFAIGRPAAARLDTRIIVVRYPVRGGERPLGLVAERVTSTLRRDPSAFVDGGVASPGAPYLGPVASDAGGLVQRIELAELLPASVADVLFTEPVDTIWPSPTSSSS